LLRVSLENRVDAKKKSCRTWKKNRVEIDASAMLLALVQHTEKKDQQFTPKK
jgi:hypothetical protein